MSQFKSVQQICGFNDLPLLLAGIPIASLVVSLLLFNQQYEQGNWPFLAVCIPMSFAYTTAYWLLMRWGYAQIMAHYPGAKELKNRILLGCLLLLGAHFLIDYGLKYLFQVLVPTHFSKPSPVMGLITTFLLSGLIITIYEAKSFYSQLQVAVAEKAVLERQQVQSQLEGLRNQVNPHFLFNSLNTLIYLIPENPEKATNFVQKLSKVYRYLLENRDASVIPLQEELDYLNAYIYLVKERFGDNLQVEIGDLSAIQHAPTIPLTLQILFENAIKHNIISAEKPLKVEVFYENKHLVVRNNLQKKNQVMDSTGVGLQNIRDRYRMLTEKEVEVIASQQFYTVALPVVELQTA